MTNQDDIIIHMARLYGTPVQEQNAEVEYRFTIEQLGLLISTVTILERGACAKVCESFKTGNSATYIDDDWADMCADAIRARGVQ